MSIVSVRLAVVHRGRALPVVWRVMAHASTSVSFTDYEEMLQQAVERLPLGVKVIVLADRGFVHTELMRALTTQFGWHYRIRVKSDCWIWRAGKGWCAPQRLPFSARRSYVPAQRSPSLAAMVWSIEPDRRS